MVANLWRHNSDVGDDLQAQIAERDQRLEQLWEQLNQLQQEKQANEAAIGALTESLESEKQRSEDARTKVRDALQAVLDSLQ